MLVCVYVGVCVCRCVCVGVCVYVLVGVQQCVCVCQCVRAPISLPAFGRVCAVACLGKSLSPVVLLLLPFHFLLPIHTLLPPRSHTRSLSHTRTNSLFSFPHHRAFFQPVGLFPFPLYPLLSPSKSSIPQPMAKNGFQGHSEPAGLVDLYEETLDAVGFGRFQVLVLMLCGAT